jgi:hypothetical protein
MLAGPNPRRWCRYLRLSLRGLIVLVLVIGAALGWIVRSARIQHNAVTAIRNAGGDVGYNWEWSNGKVLPGGKPWAPSRLVDLIGVDYFGHVTVVALYPTATAAPMVPVGRLTGLQRLDAFGSSVSDAGLAHLKGLAELSALDLDGTQLTDAGLRHLKGLTSLTWLGLRETHVTDAGLVHLKGLTKLSVLTLGGTQVTDAGLTQLKGLKSLTRLGLRGTKVTDAGPKELSQALPSLTIIR